MDKNQFQCGNPVFLSNLRFDGIIYNGLHFLLLDSTNFEILIYDCSFHYIESIALNRKYTSICFDKDEQCYWAIANCNASILYRLDMSLCDVDEFNINNSPQCSTGNICYDWCHKKLWVSFFECIGYIEKSQKSYRFLESSEEGRLVRGLFVLPSCGLSILSMDRQDCLHLALPTLSERICINIPKGFKVEGACAITINEASNCKQTPICILLTQTCDQSAYIMHCTVTCGCCRCDNCCKPDAPCPPPKCNYSCNGELCNIIHSIALEETGISHILNAEGEKIQKAVACCNTIKELLQINESVRDTITHITQLEIQLNLKLESAMRNMCCKKEQECACHEKCSCPQKCS